MTITSTSLIAEAPQSDDSNVKQGSVVGSSDGNVSMSADHQVTIHGSDVVPVKDLDINAKDVAITAAENSIPPSARSKPRAPASAYRWAAPPVAR